MPALIFDLDDTLYPHVQFVHSGFAAVARCVYEHFGLPEAEVYATLRFARQTGHRGAEFQRLCDVRRLDPAIVPQLLTVYRTHTPQLSLWDGAAATLQAVRTAGWRTAIVTNGLPSVQAEKVRVLGLEERVDHVVFADEIADGGKPAPAVFAAALAHLRADACHTVMVGNDPVADIQGAAGLGLRTIHVAIAAGPPCAAADAVVRSLADIPHVAAGLLGERVVHAA